MYKQSYLKCLGRGVAFLGLPKAKKYIATFAQANVDAWLIQGRH